jgi:hypothetical protein
MKTVKISDFFCLNSQEVTKLLTVVQPNATNHIFVVDVSGSMSSDLPHIRKQLKNKLSTLMREGDTISIIWFSGDRDSGILKEEVEVRSLKTLSDLNDAIDKWLRPVGMTAFRKPLVLTKELIERIKKNRPNASFSLIFLTDGYNNDCSWNSVLDALNKLTDDIASSTFVEYGYYADSKRIQEMATILGGERINTSDFDEFEPIFDRKIAIGGGSTKKILVDLESKNLLYDFAYSCDKDGTIILYNIVDGKVAVNESIDTIYYFTANNPVSHTSGTAGMENSAYYTMMYSAVYVLADKLKYDDAEKLFMHLGDVHFYTELMNAYGKQKLNSFKNSVKSCITDETLRFPKGKTIIKPVPDNAYCLMNLIDDLGKIEDCKLFTNHKDFQYNRIGAKKVAVGSTLTESEKEKLSSAANVAEMLEISKELEKNKLDLKFTKTDPDAGSPIKNLVWNEERANLSIQVRYEGNVSLPQNEFGIDTVASFEYRAYTIIKDGILNVSKLPVSYSDELLSLLQKHAVKFYYDKDYIVIDLSSIPIVNRGMVKSISANDLSKLEWNLNKVQGAKKVIDFYRKALFPKTSKTFAEMVSPQCAEWLKTIGITEFNGFAPKVTSEYSGDSYMSVNLITKIKGLSSLPKVEDVLAKIEKGLPLKLSESVMADELKSFIVFKQHVMQAYGTEPANTMIESHLILRSSDLDKERRALLQRIAQIKFSLILSKAWFTEFKSFDENKLNVEYDSQQLDFTFDLTEKEVKV